MQIKQEFPPNWEEIKSNFKVEGKSVVFTYGDVIYNPYGKPVTDHLAAHEGVHSVQQGNFDGGPEGWWRKYLVDPEFRLMQEAEAYAFQIFVGGKGKTRSQKRNALLIFAEALAGPIYGNPCDLVRSKKLIKEFMAKIV